MGWAELDDPMILQEKGLAPFHFGHLLVEVPLFSRILISFIQETCQFSFGFIFFFFPTLPSISPVFLLSSVLSFLHFSPDLSPW